MSDITYLAPCGNDCGRCPRHVATLDPEQGALTKVAEQWHAWGFRDKPVEPQTLACTGCTSQVLCAHGVAVCAEKRGVSNCGHCPDYPFCSRIQYALMKTDEARERIAQKDPDALMILLPAFFEKRKNLERERALYLCREEDPDPAA